MRDRHWKGMLIDSMIGPIVLAQFVAGVIGNVVQVTAELSRWLLANLINNTLMRFRADVILPFSHTHMAWAVVRLNCTRAILFTALLYLIAVWLYEQPQTVSR